MILLCTCVIISTKIMLLAVDIGNTNTVIGLFKGSRIVKRQRVASKKTVILKKLAGDVDAAMISSVVPSLDRAMSNKIRGLYGIKPVIVRWKDIKSIRVDLKARSQVGMDRLVNAVAAYALYGAPAIIIEFGTATTFCAVGRGGKYLGGAITSGLAISRDVLHDKTARLPLIEIRKPKRVIGKNTLEAMRSGLFFGYVDMVEGMIKRFKAELGQGAKVIATGGLSKLIASGTKKIDIVDQDLTLKGLYIIYRSACPERSLGDRGGR